MSEIKKIQSLVISAPPPKFFNLSVKCQVSWGHKAEKGRNWTIIVPAADAALAVAYSPAQNECISSDYKHVTIVLIPRSIWFEETHTEKRKASVAETSENTSNISNLWKKEEL